MKSDNHQHNNYIDDHHDHVHKHNIHQHNHSFSPVYTPPLPSWFQVFSHLAPIQKTIFTWFLIHGSIGIWLYCIGVSLESLSLVGFSYLMLFDALGVLNLFISSVLKTQSAFSISNIKQPFGAHRYEIVFALGTNIYLLFATMHNTKESLEHFLLESHHVQEEHENGEHHTKLTLGMFLLMGFAITATCLSSITLGNHDNFVRYLRKRPTIVHGIVYSVINRARGNPIHVLLSNIYSSSIALCGSVILLFYMFGAATPFFDKMLALFESVVMFYLGYPTAKALAKILLQTTPIAVQNGVENRLREILQDPNIIHVNHTHCWQITYGKCVGTIEIQIKPEADDQAILRFVYQKLEGLTSNNFETSGNNSSELTVSIVK
ncbi:cation efflux family-domain-containing protein [Cokeromyces recurvatus]|uniref:cation efflux family-domain-containing protein n=1 Tax=Cokeromyces recurvatus TaxID=90255 RepID=UPI00221F018A|nr:cation efflux family-domain-containing protein [Cokeromyces recurvatus]KAI7903948.1 cation efflux family-domain-containing protein [Cokeromyces recurvatus]